MSKEKHKPGEDGLLNDGVRHYAADPHDMALYAQAREALDSMRAPRLQQAENSHQRIFIAAFDGTWNDAGKDPEHLTNVGAIRNQIDALNDKGNASVSVGYVEGVGTQSNWLTRTLDGAIGYTYDERIEQMYAQFSIQAKQWLRDDPNVQISVASIGFSRGAEQAAGFARLLHERGIQDPEGTVLRKEEDGRNVVEYTKPPLVPPGQTAQAVGLFDPVGTGEPRNHDRRLPPSVISGFQLTAEDERRGLFKSTSVIDQGMTADGRLLAVMVPGAHSDVGGGYHRNGLSARSGNLMISYLNSLSDTPFLQKQPEPGDAAMNVVHRSEQGMLIYWVWDKVDRRQNDGVVEELAPRSVCRVVDDCRNAEPVDAELSRRFEFRRIGDALPSPPAAAVFGPLDPAHPDHALFRQSQSAVQRMDAGLGRASDQASERLAASLLPAAKQAGLDRIDHAVLSEHNGKVERGQYVFAVEGDPGASQKKLARVETQVATATPVAESFRQLEEANRERMQVTNTPPLPEPVMQQQEEQRRALAR